eukprot:1650629-Pyramimonas_sp.AAC.1
MPLSNWAFRKPLAAGPNYGGQARERGKGHELGPPRMHAGMAPMGGVQEMVSDWQNTDPTAMAASIDRAMDTPDDFLKPVEDNSEHGQAMATATIKMRRASESYKARNNKNRNPKEDE